MLGLKSAFFLAGASTLCLAAPTPASAPAPAHAARRSARTAATSDPNLFPVQVKITGGDLVTLDVKGAHGIVTDTLYFQPGPQGCFADHGGQVTSDGVNNLPWTFTPWTASLAALGQGAPTCYINGCLPSPAPADGPLVFELSDNGLDYIGHCGNTTGWGSVTINCEGPGATCLGDDNLTS